MESIIYIPETLVVTTNLWNANAATMTGDVAHVIKTINDMRLNNAERIAVQIKWASLNALDAVFSVRTKIHNDFDFVNEQPTESEPNSTQVTLSTAAGSKIFHLVPANWHSLELYLDRNSITVGNVWVAVSIKF